MHTTKPVNTFPAHLLRERMEEIMKVARGAAADAGLHDLPDEFSRVLDARLRLVREEVFGDSEEAVTVLANRTQSLATQYAAIEERRRLLRAQRRAETHAAGPWRHWRMMTTLVIAPVFAALVARQYFGAQVNVFDGLILGLGAAILIVNLEALASLPRQLNTCWTGLRERMEAGAQWRACRRELKTVRFEAEERNWRHQQANSWVDDLREAALAEYRYNRTRAALARTSS